MRRMWIAGLILVAVLAALAVTVHRVAAPTVSPARLALSALARNPDVDPGTPLDRPAPNFTLQNQFGQPVALRQYRGKAVILAFVDAECTTICPLTTTSMTEAVGMLGPAAKHVALVGIDANPTATSIADVRSYSVVHGVLHQWNFLTGSRAQLDQVWRRYGIYVAIVKGQIDHTPALYVIDPKGRERFLFMTQMSYAGIDQQAQVLAHAVASVLPGHPAVRSHLSYAWLRGEGPTVAVTLPTADGKTVAVGPGAPHLLVFFATWLRQTANLPAALTALNEYQAVAVKDHLPGVVAVDEAPTEPPGALSALLKALPTRLTYPVAVDTTGRLADGYGVQGLPWYVLTTANGRILWQSANFVAPTTLEHAVADALKRPTP